MDRRPGILHITYIMEGDSGRVVLTEPADPVSRRHELWRRTCFEVFFCAPGRTVYWEGNFSPSGDWNVYRFTGYRQGMTEEQRLGEPLCRAESNPHRLELSCSLQIHEILPDSDALTAGIACVVLETSGRVSYWAIDHCGEKPDFHDHRSFLLQLPAIGTPQDIFLIGTD